jgi:hypothetical protein
VSVHVEQLPGVLWDREAMSNQGKDNRGWVSHKVHQWGHEYNAYRKENGQCGIETTKVYRATSPKKAREPGKEWSVKVDKDRAEYHKSEASKQSWTKMF